MNTLDQKGLDASTALTQLIAYIADHPKDPIPMEQIRPAIQLQAEYTLAIGIDKLVHIVTGILDEYITENADHPERETPPTAA